MSLELEQAQNEIAALQRRLTEYAAEVERLRTDHALYVEETDAYWKRTVEVAKAENDRLRGQVGQMREAAQAYLVGPDRDEFDPVTGLACGCCGKNIAEDGTGHEDRCPVGIAIAVSSDPIADNKPDCYVDANAKSTLNALEECRQERDKLKEGAKQILEALRSAEIRVTDVGYVSDIRKMVQEAFAKARELGLLEDK